MPHGPPDRTSDVPSGGSGVARRRASAALRRSTPRARRASTGDLGPPVCGPVTMARGSRATTGSGLVVGASLVSTRARAHDSRPGDRWTGARSGRPWARRSHSVGRTGRTATSQPRARVLVVEDPGRHRPRCLPHPDGGCGVSPVGHHAVSSRAPRPGPPRSRVALAVADPRTPVRESTGPRLVASADVRWADTPSSGRVRSWRSSGRASTVAARTARCASTSPWPVARSWHGAAGTRSADGRCRW